MADAPHPWQKLSIAFAILLGATSFITQQLQRSSDRSQQESKHKEEQQKQAKDLDDQRLATVRAEELTRRAVKAAEDSASANKVLAEIARGSLQAQTRSARAAEENIKTIGNNFQFENRPQIVIDNMRSELLDTGKLTITLVFTNSGKSPALNPKSNCQLFYNGIALGPMTNNRPGNISLGPGKYEVPCSADLNSEQMKSVKAGTSKIRWQGGYTYDDSFGHSNLTGGGCFEYIPGSTTSLRICP